MRVVAIDWSGARRGAARRIWLAEVVDGRLARLESGRTREEIGDHLIAEAQRDPNLVVGLDFAFSFPAWYVRQGLAEDARSFWRLVAQRGEGWLGACDPPFWGRPGCPRPGGGEPFRRTEIEVREQTAARPKSVFQVGGAGAVGTGSVRGIPLLSRLGDAAFSIWPFDNPTPPLAIEIYPRLLTGAVVKTDPVARIEYLRRALSEISDRYARIAATTDDAFDAAISAVVMARHVVSILDLPVARDDVERLEGRIWLPDGARAERTTSVTSPNAGTSTLAGCPFCDVDSVDILAESSHSRAIADRFPLTHGHALVIPKTHVASLFDLEQDARSDLWGLVARVRANLLERQAPDGFTIGLNDGEAAGQTVAHAHVHVIPRRDGDVADPRGGIRWVLPDRARYWEEL